jgi:hypothetical protein
MALPALATTWEIDGVSLNTGLDIDTGFSYVVQKSKGWRDGPPSRPQLDDRPTSPGAYRSPNYYGPRVIELEGIAQATYKDERELLSDTLAGLCADPDNQFQLVCHERTRSLYAWVERLSSASVIDQPDGFTVAFNLQFVATDPRKFSTTVKTDQTAIAQAALLGVEWDGPAVPTTGTQWGGPTSPITGVVWQASSGVSGIMALDNEGTASAPIQFTITAPVTGTLIQPSITDITNGNALVYSGTLVPGDVLTIDTATGLMLLNGSAAGGQLVGDLFEIPRRSTIQVQFAANGPADTAQLAAVWADAF